MVISFNGNIIIYLYYNILSVICCDVTVSSALVRPLVQSDLVVPDDVMKVTPYTECRSLGDDQVPSTSLASDHRSRDGVH